MAKFITIVLISFFLIFQAVSFGSAETVKIIAEDDWYPYSGLTAEGIKGLAVDMVRESFKAEGIDVEFEVMNYDRGMLLVKDGLAIGCFDAPRTVEIEDLYYWHAEPMFMGQSFFYATLDFEGQVNSLADLSGKTLGLTQGYGYGDAIDMDNSIHKQYSKSDEIIIKKLIAKRVDFIILFDLVADYLMLKLNAGGQIKQVGPAESSGIYVAFSRKHPDGKKYCDIFSKGFQKIKEDGTYEKVSQTWDRQLKPQNPDTLSLQE